MLRTSNLPLFPDACSKGRRRNHLMGLLSSLQPYKTKSPTKKGQGQMVGPAAAFPQVRHTCSHRERTVLFQYVIYHETVIYHLKVSG